MGNVGVATVILEGTASEEVRHPCAFHVHTQCTILYGSVGVECKNNDARRTDVVPPLGLH